MIAGGLGTVFAVSCIVSPDLRGTIIQWRLDQMPAATLRQTAAVEALRYDSALMLLLWWSLLPAAWGFAGGTLSASMFARTALRWRVSLSVVFVILTCLFIFPVNRGLVFASGQDQFAWAARLEADDDSSRTEAINASVTLLTRNRFPGRLQLVQLLAHQGDQALPALEVLKSLQRDPEPMVRDAADYALQILQESWERQVDAVRGGVSTRIEIVHHSVTDEMFQQLTTDCEHLEVLLLDRTELTPATLQAVLPHIRSLKRLKIGGHVPRELFPVLATMSDLEVLNLPDADCPDSALATLQTLPQLNLLRIRSSGITNDGLPALQSFLELKYLHLIGTSITNEGLTHIAQVKGLQSFYLDGSDCTESGLSQLLEVRPDLHVHWNDLHLDGDPNTDVHASPESF